MRPALITSVRKTSIRGSRIPYPNTYKYVLNHGKFIVVLRKCLHAVINSPRVWKKNANVGRSRMWCLRMWCLIIIVS